MGSLQFGKNLKIGYKMEAYKRDIYDSAMVQLDPKILEQEDYEEFIDWIDKHSKDALSTLWSRFRYRTLRGE